MTICPSFDIYLHTMHQSITLLYASNGLIARLRSMYAPSPLSTTEIILLLCLPSYTTQSHSTSTQHIYKHAWGSKCENLKWPLQLPNITRFTTVWSKRFKLKITFARMTFETVLRYYYLSIQLTGVFLKSWMAIHYVSLTSLFLVLHFYKWLCNLKLSRRMG